MVFQTNRLNKKQKNATGNSAILFYADQSEFSGRNRVSRKLTIFFFKHIVL